METFVWHAIAATVLPLLGLLGVAAIVAAVASKFFGHVPKGYKGPRKPSNVGLHGESTWPSSEALALTGRVFAARKIGALYVAIDHVQHADFRIQKLIEGTTLAADEIELIEVHKALVEAEKSLEKLRAG
jgi:hypothetical protein